MTGKRIRKLSSFRLWHQFWLQGQRIRTEFKAISQSVFKLLHEKAAPLVVFLYKLKKLA